MRRWGGLTPRVLNMPQICREQCSRRAQRPDPGPNMRAPRLTRTGESQTQAPRPPRKPFNYSSKNFSGGPVAQSGLRRRPPEPEIRGSNPRGPATLVCILGIVPPSARPYSEVQISAGAAYWFHSRENLFIVWNRNFLSETVTYREGCLLDCRLAPNPFVEVPHVFLQVF